MTQRSTTNRPIRKLHRLAPAAYATTEYEYHFTVCARHHRDPFSNEDLAQEVISSLLWAKKRYGCLLFCYCLMPDHLHFVCRLTDREIKFVNAGHRGFVREGVLDHLSRFKSFTTNKSWQFGLRGRLWQKSSYDRVLDLDWPFEEVALYVLDNPIRRGLVKHWYEWKHSAIVDPWW